MFEVFDEKSNLNYKAPPRPKRNLGDKAKSINEINQGQMKVVMDEDVNKDYYKPKTVLTNPKAREAQTYNRGQMHEIIDHAKCIKTNYYDERKPPRVKTEANGVAKTNEGIMNILLNSKKNIDESPRPIAYGTGVAMPKAKVKVSESAYNIAYKDRHGGGVAACLATPRKVTPPPVIDNPNFNSEVGKVIAEDKNRGYKSARKERPAEFNEVSLVFDEKGNRNYRTARYGVQQERSKSEMDFVLDSALNKGYTSPVKSRVKGSARKYANRDRGELGSDM